MRRIASTISALESFIRTDNGRSKVSDETIREGVRKRFQAIKAALRQKRNDPDDLKKKEADKSKAERAARNRQHDRRTKGLLLLQEAGNHTEKELHELKAFTAIDLISSEDEDTAEMPDQSGAATVSVKVRRRRQHLWRTSAANEMIQALDDAGLEAKASSKNKSKQIPRVPPADDNVRTSSRFTLEMYRLIRKMEPKYVNQGWVEWLLRDKTKNPNWTFGMDYLQHKSVSQHPKQSKKQWLAQYEEEGARIKKEDSSGTVPGSSIDHGTTKPGDIIPTHPSTEDNSSRTLAQNLLAEHRNRLPHLSSPTFPMNVDTPPTQHNPTWPILLFGKDDDSPTREASLEARITPNAFLSVQSTQSDANPVVSCRFENDLARDVIKKCTRKPRVNDVGARDSTWKCMISIEIVTNSLRLSPFSICTRIRDTNMR